MGKFLCRTIYLYLNRTKNIKEVPPVMGRYSYRAASPSAYFPLPALFSRKMKDVMDPRKKFSFLKSVCFHRRTVQDPLLLAESNNYPYLGRKRACKIYNSNKDVF